MVLFLFETKGAGTGLRSNGKEQEGSDIQAVKTQQKSGRKMNRRMLKKRNGNNYLIIHKFLHLC